MYLFFPRNVQSKLCFCIYSYECTYPSGIYPTLTGFSSYEYYGSIIPPIVSSTEIPGLLTGCTPYQSILESTLQCFYNNQCLSELFNQTNIKPLNSSIDSTFTIDTKIRTLIEQFFIESWSIEKDFESFFNECRPNQCTYSYNSRGTIAFVITTMLSLVGGLFIALKIASSLMVILYKKIKNMIVLRLSTISFASENNQSK